jgi:hypothetical protein
MLVEDSITVIWLKTDHQHDAEEEKEKDFQKTSCFVDFFIRPWDGPDLH